MDKLRIIKELLENKKAEDVVIMDVSSLTNIADYFVIASANSPTHARALADYLREELQKRDVYVDHVEGYESGEWILLDLIDVLVHIFLPDVRKYYDLEWLYATAPRVSL
ncbi:ribosome silencing factor [Thermocrinis minervae]|uniref:Ribosomal silencing factor RsfS n=1 Tax=Thermocrinis minervae TaxID=381751 RepID=A0A1M6RAJ0_9AQUI|nr:ribosome silencing factor [Thermocrinis minervae]SHK29489.1 ribosome-associated protein [Thermocrinis minervae]